MRSFPKIGWRLAPGEATSISWRERLLRTLVRPITASPAGWMRFSVSPIKDGKFYVTQQTEVTRITDQNGDGRADHFETLSDRWGFNNYHEFAFGSKLDPEGNIWVALCLSKSYQSDEPFRGWCVKVTPQGKSIPVCSGIRSPCGIGPNEHGVMFYAESQGPWNGSCSLKVLEPGGFMGHPASLKWYDLAPELGEKPTEPNTRSRLMTERKRVKQLVPYAVVFPYIKMGRSISGFVVDRTGGKFGPFENQIFIGDFSLSVVMRATTEKINGVWQGACYPFREGLATGLLGLRIYAQRRSARGRNQSRLAGARSPALCFAATRLDGKNALRNQRDQRQTERLFDHVYQAGRSRHCVRSQVVFVTTYTHIYRAGYGSPGSGSHQTHVTKAVVADDGLSVQIEDRRARAGPRARLRPASHSLRQMREASASECLLHPE